MLSLVFRLRTFGEESSRLGRADCVRPLRDTWRAQPALYGPSRIDGGFWGSAPVVLAEVYPRAMYAIALRDELPSPAVHVGKTKRAARGQALEIVGEASWLRRSGVRLGSMEPAARDEDEFDAFITAVALARLALAGRLTESR